MCVLTISVHSGMQYPDISHIGSPGGRAYLSVYSMPISIIPASYGRSVGVTWNVSPELSITPGKVYTCRIVDFKGISRCLNG